MYKKNYRFFVCLIINIIFLIIISILNIGNFNDFLNDLSLILIICFIILLVIYGIIFDLRKKKILKRYSILISNKDYLEAKKKILIYIKNSTSPAAKQFGNYLLLTVYMHKDDLNNAKKCIKDHSKFRANQIILTFVVLVFQFYILLDDNNISEAKTKIAQINYMYDKISKKITKGHEAENIYKTFTIVKSIVLDKQTLEDFKEMSNDYMFPIIKRICKIVE